jgi:hypothetical protein
LKEQGKGNDRKKVKWDAVQGPAYSGDVHYVNFSLVLSVPAHVTELDKPGKNE